MINESFIAELQNEAKSTRRLLERVPFDNPDWKPHEKSMTLKVLSAHVAELPDWINYTINAPELDFATTDYKPKDIRSADDLVKLHDKVVASAAESLKNCTDGQMMENWTLRDGEQVFFTMPRVAVLRGMCFNHLYHHRGQLTVYLRLLGVPLPGIYGPTADENVE